MSRGNLEVLQSSGSSSATSRRVNAGEPTFESYVLSEINVSSVSPFLEAAIPKLAQAIASDVG